MNISNPTIIGYNKSDIVLSTKTLAVKQQTGKTEYDGSKIDNLSLQNGKLVSFVNQDGNNVKVYIDNSTIEKLASKFGDNSFISADDNTLKASGKAEGYLASFWQVAQSNILVADKDKNGILEKQEILDVKLNPESGGDINLKQGTMSFSSGGMQSINENAFLTQKAKNSLADQFGVMSVDTLFSQLLQYDKNIDGSLSVGETISTDRLNNIYNEFANNQGLALYEEITIGGKTVVYKEFVPTAKDLQEAHKQELKKQEQDSLEKSDKKQKTEDNDKTQQAAKKLLASNGDESVLTAEEKEALGAELKAIQKRLETKDELSDVKDEVAEKITETRFLDTIG